MIKSVQLQATHRRQEPVCQGVWGDHTGGSWEIEACREHAPKVICGAPEGF